MIGFYEAVDVFGVWYGTATLGAIKKAGLIADGFIGYAPEHDAIDGWACRAARR